mmetsp:Transcript_12421/g.27262  ORF Transcript_12421/g.27262 Transcript_12421/m.27262 type:complete len:213 (+) Transcript_12421:1040-1678(+)
MGLLWPEVWGQPGIPHPGSRRNPGNRHNRLHSWHPIEWRYCPAVGPSVQCAVHVAWPPSSQGRIRLALLALIPWWASCCCRLCRTGRSDCLQNAGFRTPSDSCRIGAWGSSTCSAASAAAAAAAVAPTPAPPARDSPRAPGLRGQSRPARPPLPRSSLGRPLQAVSSSAGTRCGPPLPLLWLAGLAARQPPELQRRPKQPRAQLLLCWEARR